MVQIIDPLRQHDWNSKEYVENWAQRQRRNETLRARQFALLASLVPFESEAAFRFMDVGCGYGALSKFLLESFPHATAVCHDGSAAMAKLGAERMNELEGRFEYVVSDFSKKDWSQVAGGEFDLVVSCNAIHNVRAGEVIKAIYEEIHGRLRSGAPILQPRPRRGIGGRSARLVRKRRVPRCGVPREGLRTLPLRRLQALIPAAPAPSRKRLRRARRPEAIPSPRLPRV